MRSRESITTSESECTIKRLKLSELELWKRKAKALDEALEYLQGRASTEEGLRVQFILERA